MMFKFKADNIESVVETITDYSDVTLKVRMNAKSLEFSSDCRPALVKANLRQESEKLVDAPLAVEAEVEHKKVSEVVQQSSIEEVETNTIGEIARKREGSEVGHNGKKMTTNLHSMCPNHPLQAPTLLISRLTYKHMQNHTGDPSISTSAHG